MQNTKCLTFRRLATIRLAIKLNGNTWRQIEGLPIYYIFWFSHLLGFSLRSVFISIITCIIEFKVCFNPAIKKWGGEFAKVSQNPFTCNIWQPQPSIKRKQNSDNTMCFQWRVNADTCVCWPCIISRHEQNIFKTIKFKFKKLN